MTQYILTRLRGIAVALFLFISLICTNAHAQSWTWNYAGVLTGNSPNFSRVEPADFDGDGFTDFAVFNSTTGVSVIRKGAGNGTFSDFFSMGMVNGASGDWGDYDNDGDLDLAVAGRIAGISATCIFRYDRESQSFTYVLVSTIGNENGDITWLDSDADGDLDLVGGGGRRIGPAVVNSLNLWINTGNNSFTLASGAFNVAFGMPRISASDLNNDGLTDILISDGNPSSSFLQVFISSGNNTFTRISTTIPITASSDHTAADMDDDGDMDIVAAGNSLLVVAYNTGINAQGQPIFGNTRNLDAHSLPALDVADLNQDGYTDIFIQGSHSASGTVVTDIYLNSAAGTFTKATANLLKLSYGTLRFAYLDSDTKLDILQTGLNSIFTEYVNRYYLATYTANANAAPSAPNTGFSFSQDGCNSGRLFWAHAADDITPASALRYNIRIGTSPGAQNIRASMANLTTGRRFHMSTGLLPRPSNGLPIRDLAPGIYYYSVQAVDANGLGGAWSVERTFTVDSYPSATLQSSYTVVSGDELFIDQTLSATGSISYSYSRAAVTGIANAAVSYPWPFYSEKLYNTTASPVQVNYQFTAVVAGCTSTKTVPVTVLPMVQALTVPTVYGDRTDHVWADFDRDGDLDIFIVGSSTTGPRSEIWLNNGTGQMTVLAGLGIPGIAAASADVGDLDNDGWPDIVISGVNTSSQATVQIWRNNRNNTFTRLTHAIFATNSGEVSLGDSDNDGDLDILMTGISSGLRVLQLWLNNGQAVFSFASNVALTPVAQRSAKWIDIDGDGDLDIFINGMADAGRVSHIYRNDGNNTFVKLADQITPVSHGDVDVMDYNADGDLDLLITGDKGNSEYATEVWDNDGAGSFSRGSVFTGVTWSSVHWLDINKDIMRDAVVTGITTSGQRVTEIWCFIPASPLGWQRISLGVGLGYSDVSSGDIDNDGDLDLLITGNTGSSFVTMLLRNVTTASPNTAPTFPARPTATLIGCGSVRINFSRASDAGQSVGSLTYAYRLGTASGTDNIRPGHALSNGRRLVGGHGHLIHGYGSFPIHNLAPGTYYLSIQAIDMMGVGSTWSPELVFTVPVPPTLTSATSRALCTGAPLSYTATSATSGLTFSWSRAAIPGISNAAVPNTTGATISETLLNTTSAAITVPYIVRMTTSYGCTVSTTLTVVVNPTPIAPVLSHTINSNECAGNVVTVNNMEDYAGAQINWAGGQSGDMYFILPGMQTVQPTITSASGCVLVGPAISIRGKTPGGWLGRNTNWNDNTNWCGGLPDQSFNAVFEATDQVMPIISSRSSINNITLPAGKTLTVSAGAQLVMYGNKSGAGTLDLALGSVLELRGSSQQYLEKCTIPSLLIESQGTVTIGPGVFVNTSLNIQSGNVVAANAGTFVLRIATFMNQLTINTPATVTVPMALSTYIGTGTLSALGVQIGGGVDNLDTVYVERRYMATSAMGNSGIGCTWRIRTGAQPINGRQLTLSWPSGVTAGKRMNALQVWRRPDNGTSWLKVGTVQNRTAVAANPSISVTTNSFSDWTVSDQNTPLPVTWLALHALALANSTMVSWTTAQELNNAGFTVQFSLDGSEWQNLVYLPSKASTTANAGQYLYEDIPRTQGYYRIQQHDLDGTVTHSPVVAIKAQNTMLTLSLLPNPAKDQVQVLGLWEAENVHVLDAQGRLVKTALAHPQNGLEIKDLPMGVYTIKCRGQVLRLVKE